MQKSIKRESKNKRNKRGQVTIFVIIAIIIVAITALYFTLRKPAVKPVPTELEAIYSYVQSCVDDSLSTGLALIGLSGGYIIPPAESLITDYAIISYWFYNSSDISPSIVDMEEQLNLYIETSTLLCVNFSKFPSYEITEGNITAESKIESEKVSLEVEWLLTIKKGEKTTLLETPYKTEQKIRIGMIHDFSKGVVDRLILEPDQIPLSYLVASFNVNGMNVTTVPYDDSIIYITTDIIEEHALEGIPYTFMFAAS